MSLKYNEIGKTGMKVARLAFGASSLGGVFHTINEKEAINAVFTAVDNGLNFIDVSPYYGDFSGFPPAFITCESHETLFADSAALDGLLEKAGVSVKTVQLDGSFHAYAALGERTPETKKILDEWWGHLYFVKNIRT